MGRFGINLKDIEFSEFTAGELNISINILSRIDSLSEIMIYAHLKNSTDIIKLLLVVDAINEYNPNTLHVFIPYLPYSRQDNIFNEGEALSLRVIGRLLNTMKVDKIFTLDIHSVKAYAWVKNLNNFKQEWLFTFPRTNNTLLICPDEGAIERTTRIAKADNLNIAYFKKVRDPKTRKILSIKTNYEPFLIKGKDCVISDDICDGGRTFMEIAKILKGHFAKTVSLYVSHGIFSYGLKQIFDANIDRIICGDHMVSLNVTDKELEYYLENEQLILHETLARF